MAYYTQLHDTMIAYDNETNKAYAFLCLKRIQISFPSPSIAHNEPDMGCIKGHQIKSSKQRTSLPAFVHHFQYICRAKPKSLCQLV